MNILNLLIKKKHITGIEINNDAIRIAYFRPKKGFIKKTLHKKETESELMLIEEPVSATIIKNGVVIDKEFLGKVLKDIWTKAMLSSNYAIVSIPEEKIYSRIFPFPKTSSENQLTEAINLAINFQLPSKRNDIYVGWENAGDSHTINEILISSIDKNIANDYIDALNFAGIKILALESHIASIARSIKLKLGQTTQITKRNSDSTTIFILKDGSMRFSRVIPNTIAKEKDFLQKESNNIKTFFETEKKVSVTEINLNETPIRDIYLKYPELNDLSKELQSKWLISMGAAIRGKIQKGKDNQISLLSIGTAEAYAYQKINTFIELIRNLTIAISIFFLLTFTGAYLFIYSIAEPINKTNISIPLLPKQESIIKNENLIKKVNNLTEISKTILYKTPTWSVLLEDINSRIIQGIIISNFSVTSVNDLMRLVGIAKDRETLNKFKNTLQESIYLTSVDLPITNLEQKGNIPFSMSFRLKDPNMLYYK